MDELQQDEQADRRMAERLLRGGVGLRHVRRTLRELRDHRADLVARLMEQGYDQDSAARDARIELGDREQLATQMLSRPELRSRARRFALLVFLLGPVPMVCAGGLLALLAMEGILLAFGLTSPDARPTEVEMSAVRVMLQWTVPVIVGLFLCRTAARRRLSDFWPACAIVLVALSSAATRFQAVVPPAGRPVTTLSFGPPFDLPRTVLLATALGLTYLLMVRAERHRSERHA
jgi:hypothetical protein